ncbi:MAG: type IV toxin-antitoxin system AbiEi family antitoxin domain-containing protein [Frankiaceae bacterium]|jgi:predicted transcriptional regulator of viral defense system|nr:type IV toxin-antitoxin system AbiEi family antitoxin domain-containing protein [Frankiaceae bacterium]
MKATAALRELADLTASQWGMATSAQAARLGIGRLELSRLAASGHLERLGHGVYRATAAPVDPREGIKAIWLSINPGSTVDERLFRRPFDAVVSGSAASWLLEAGDLVPEPYEYTTPTRRFTQRTDLTYRTRMLPEDSVTIREGLPVTTFEQTIADLVETHIDHSLIADVIADVPNLDRARLADLLAPLASRYGHSPGDGRALLADLDQSPRKRRYAH